MKLGSFLNAARSRRRLGWVLWPALLLALLAVVVLLPGWIRVLGDDASRSVVPESGSAWRAAPEFDSAELGHVVDELGPDADDVHAIDDAWLAAERAPAEDTDSATLACIIEPFQVVEIGSPVTGLIDSIHVERSDRVEVGQVLVELESGVERAAVRLARSQAGMNEEVEARQANAALGKRRKERVQRLYEQETLSLDLLEEVETEAEVALRELEQAQAEKRLASLQLEQAIALLSRRTIRSPINGVVVERKMSAGERVDEEVILELAQLDPLRVEVILPPSAYGSVEVGMRAAVVPEFPGDTVHLASVTIVDRIIDAASGTFGVRLELPNPDHQIPGGLHCQVQFLTE